MVDNAQRKYKRAETNLYNNSPEIWSKLKNEKHRSFNQQSKNEWIIFLKTKKFTLNTKKRKEGPIKQLRSRKNAVVIKTKPIHENDF